MTGALVSASWLRKRLGDPAVRVVDCRWRLGEPGAGEPLWRAGHIPGAAHLDLDRELAGPPGAGGRHPLPAPAAFEAAARRAGIGRKTFVAAYDEAGEGGAARLWWLLRHFGHDQAAVLDGGLRGWREEGGPLETGAAPATEAIRAGDFSAAPREDDTAALADEAGAGVGGRASRDATRVLLDARAPKRFRGEHEPVDPVAGHIPGASNLPFAELAPNGRFLPAAELRSRFEAAGAAPGSELVAYCGSGVTACVLVLAAELAGLGPARLYPGSWSEWSSRGLPVSAGR